MSTLANRNQDYQMILQIETSTDVCSVALSHEGHTILGKVNKEGMHHASVLTPLIDSLLDEANVDYSALQAVAVSSGPGSYTGLRIGVSTAKGIAYARRLKLISVGTLNILAHAIFAADESCNVACPMLDARRMEVYTALIGRDGQIFRPTEAMVVDKNSFGTELAQMKVSFGGNGSDKCRAVLTSPNAHFVGGIVPLAADMSALAYDKFCAGQFESIAYFEPFYLKEFVATTPKNKVLNI